MSRRIELNLIPPPRCQPALTVALRSHQHAVIHLDVLVYCISSSSFGLPFCALVVVPKQPCARLLCRPHPHPTEDAYIASGHVFLVWSSDLARAKPALGPQMATATMPHVEADSASIYSHRSQSHPHPHLHRSHGSNGHHHHHHHHRKRSKNGPAGVGGSLDVHVRVHSAEAFWQGKPGR